VSGNFRQRVFDAMEPGLFLSPQEVKHSTALSVESCRAVLKWMVEQGLADRQRKGRAFLYARKKGSARPLDGRTANGKTAANDHPSNRG
jgi:hypothetical protein